jgi:hypothetical protein
LCGTLGQSEETQGLEVGLECAGNSGANRKCSILSSLCCYLVVLAMLIFIVDNGTPERRFLLNYLLLALSLNVSAFTQHFISLIIRQL